MKRLAQITLLAACIVAVAACGSSGHKASSSSTSVPSTVSSTTSVPATSPSSVTTSPPSTATTGTTATSASATTVPSNHECGSGQLTAGLSGAQGTAGTVYYQLTFTNSSSTTCTMQGYPGVSFVTGSAGQQLGAPAARITGSAPVVTLAPGHTATATLGIVEASNFGSSCQLANVDGLRVYPPNNTAALFVAHSDQGCANTADVTLKIQPVQAS